VVAAAPSASSRVDRRRGGRVSARVHGPRGRLLSPRHCQPLGLPERGVRLVCGREPHGARRASSAAGLFRGFPPPSHGRRVGAHRGSAHNSELPGVEQRLERAAAMAATFEFVAKFGVPAATPNRFIWRSLSARAAADGADVILGGDGGDELFGASADLLADLLRSGRVRETVTEARVSRAWAPTRGCDGSRRRYFGTRSSRPAATLARHRSRRPPRPPGARLADSSGAVAARRQPRRQLGRRDGPRW
jgi:hypothetical protein